MIRKIVIVLVAFISIYNINAGMIDDMVNDLIVSSAPPKSTVSFYENVPFLDLSLDSPLDNEINGIKLRINIEVNKEYSFIFSDDNSKIYTMIDEKNEGFCQSCKSNDIYYSFKTKKGKDFISWENTLFKNDKNIGKTKIITKHNDLNLLTDTEKKSLIFNPFAYLILSSIFYIPDKDIKINDEWDFSLSKDPGVWISDVGAAFKGAKIVRNISIDQKSKLLGFANYENKRCAVIEINGNYEFCQLTKKFSISGSDPSEGNNLYGSVYKILLLLDYNNKSLISIKFYNKFKGIFYPVEYLGDIAETYKIMKEKLANSQLGDKVANLYMNSEMQIFLKSK